MKRMTETEIYNYIVDQLVPSEVPIDNDIGIVRSYILYVIEDKLKELNDKLNQEYNVTIKGIRFTDDDAVTLYLSRPNVANNKILEDIRLLINYYTGFNENMIFTDIILYYIIKDNKINEPTYTFDDFHYSLRDPDTLQLILHLVYEFDIDEQQFKKYFENTTGLEVYSIELLDTNEIVVEFISPKITKLSDKFYNKLLNELNNMRSPTINDKYWREAVQYVRENL